MTTRPTLHALLPLLLLLLAGCGDGSQKPLATQAAPPAAKAETPPPAPAPKAAPAPQPAPDPKLTQPATGAKAAPMPMPETISLLTLNLCVDPVNVPERIPALRKLLAEHHADIIALQEVATPFAEALAREKWAKGVYDVTRMYDKPTSVRGLYLMSRFPIKKMDFKVLPSMQERGALVAYLDVRGRTFAVGTVHLESFLEDGPRRAVQLDQTFPMLDEAEDGVLLGDFNFGEGEPESEHLDKRFADVWRALKPDDPGFTWDPVKSPFAKRQSLPKEGQRRIDRILVRSERWTPKSIELLGDQPIDAEHPDLFPSDHFALRAELEWKE
ncbi:MAG: endonuclease/exonuclease/phosphatase family protein [Planctomycetes bacterium]|nr:endonuclease/exonuclease/phosphatase family protein [Planctomycetota bacterium]